ncbi:hypothetical protein FB451DRAFT_1027106 [Mycena latifolia]|nr:hypothetical protein FB451DRAFT_1027106 [Mycena latifolia]
MSLASSPTHLAFVVEFNKGDFASLLRARRFFAQGEILAVLTTCAPQNNRTYSSVQCGKGSEDNMEFNSDVVYANHSCEPNTVVDLSSANPMEWNIRALTNIETGSAVTWFYPSTEWEMVQAFQCQCGAKNCLGRIQGAKFLTRDEVAARGLVSPWIEELLSERANKDVE